MKTNFTKLLIFKKSRISYFILLKGGLNILEDFKEIYFFGENARKNENYRFPRSFVFMGGTREASAPTCRSP